MSVFVFNEDFYSTCAALLLRQRSEPNFCYSCVAKLIESNVDLFELKYKEKYTQSKEEILNQVKKNTKNLDFGNFLKSDNIKNFLMLIKVYLYNSTANQDACHIIANVYRALIEHMLSKDIINFQ